MGNVASGAGSTRCASIGLDQGTLSGAPGRGAAAGLAGWRSRLPVVRTERVHDATTAPRGEE
ncbi:MAG TPA: hypothetical protein VE287_00415 [Actinopolymorphaceae bacterium]|nr:hypothetical protein [Actinopolymorphaceae bacterium]